MLTRPDARSGRGRKEAASPVAERADAAGIPVLQPRSPREPEFLEQLAALDVDCAPVVAYGALVPQAALDLPRHGWVNLHFSLLPGLARGGARAARDHGRRRDHRRLDVPPRGRAGHRAGLRHGDRADRPAGHRRRPPGPARRQRRRAAGRHPRRDRRRQPGRRAPAGRGRQPGAAHRDRRRADRLVAARRTSSTAGSAASHRLRAPGRRGGATGCGWARSTPLPDGAAARPARCRSSPAVSSWGPAEAPSAWATSSRRASGCCRPPTGRAGPGRCPESRSAHDPATAQDLQRPAPGPAAAPGHPPSGARRRPADRLRRPRRRLLARRLRQPAAAPAAARAAARGAGRRLRHPAGLRDAARPGHPRRDPHRAGVPPAGRAGPAGARPAPARAPTSSSTCGCPRTRPWTPPSTSPGPSSAPGRPVW